MKKCKKCSAILSDEANFCSNCGSTEFFKEPGATAVLNENMLKENRSPQQINQQPQGTPMPNYQQLNFQQPPLNQMGMQQSQNIFMQNNIPPFVNRATVSRSEFLKKYAAPSLNKEWNNIGIFFYVAAGLGIILGIVMANPLDLICSLILLGLALGTHFSVDKPCAIILLILSCLNTLGCMVLFGMPSGWLWIIVSALAVSKIGKIDAQYKQFRSGLPF